MNYTSEYITEEPDAVVPHVRICVGAVQVTGRPTTTGSELLIGLLKTCQNRKLVKKLIAGVETDNLASNKLLQKVGFVAGEEGENGVTFYEYKVL